MIPLCLSYNKKILNNIFLIDTSETIYACINAFERYALNHFKI